ncbi:hypothetical protein [Sphingobacterium multivorum]
MRKIYLYICFFFMLLMRVNAQEIHAIKGETAYPFLLKDAAPGQI